MKLIMECDLRGCQFTSAEAQCQKLGHFFQGSFALTINDNDKINRSRFHKNQWMHSYQTTTMMTSVIWLLSSALRMGAEPIQKDTTDRKGSCRCSNRRRCRNL